MKNKKILLLGSIIGVIIILGFSIGIAAINSKKAVIEPAKEVTKKAESIDNKLEEEKKAYEQVVKSSEKDFDKDLRDKLDEIQNIYGLISNLETLEIVTYKYGSEDELKTRNSEYITKLMTSFTNNESELTVWTNKETKIPKEGDRVMMKYFTFQTEDGVDIKGSAIAYYDGETDKATLMNITVYYE